MENLTERLEGSIVTLEPLAEEHEEELWEAAQAPEIWAWLAHLDRRETFERWFEMSLEAARSGAEGTFATREVASGHLVGSSRYLNVRPPDRSLEIGWTWLNPNAWRSGANVEAKLLMMGHAFETLGCVRVEFKTDARNERSRAALAALPARFEGVMRNHMTVPDVGLRDSAYFSVIDCEWPGVKGNLEARLRRGGGDRPLHGGDPGGSRCAMPTRPKSSARWSRSGTRCRRTIPRSPRTWAAARQSATWPTPGEFAVRSTSAGCAIPTPSSSSPSSAAGRSATPSSPSVPPMPAGWSATGLPSSRPSRSSPSGAARESARR